MRNIIKILLFPILCFAEEWSLIGPSDVKVYNYLAYPQILSTADGLLLNSSGVWVKYSTGLPVWNTIYFNEDSVLLIMGDGSKSDGIYIFDLTSKDFHLIQYLSHPRFLYFEPIESIYYVGYEFGCSYSSNGVKWTEILDFSGKDCFGMTTHQGNYTISTSDGIYYSAVFYSTWYKSELSLYLIDLSSDWNGNFYGIYPDGSRSSGLWVSKDHGKTWNNEFYAFNMSTVYFNYNYLFVGWQRVWEDYRGVAIWDTTKKELHFINNGLPKAAVNNFSTNNLIDCINIICCTDSGVYFSFNFEPSEIINLNTQQQPLDFQLAQNYPNPFNPSTTIKFRLPASNYVSLKIYNLAGQEIETLVNEYRKAGEYEINLTAEGLPSGIYFFQLKAGKYSETKKLTIVK